MNGWLKSAWVFSVTPLVVGVSIFFSWWLTRAEGLVLLGIFTLFGGIVCALVTLVCLFVAHSVEKKQTVQSLNRLTVHTTAILMVIFASFVAAFACMVGAAAIESRYRLAVTNDSDRVARQVVAHGGGVRESFGDIPSGGTVTRSFWIKGDGELLLTATYGTDQIEVVVDPYVTNSLGADVRLKINDKELTD